MRFDSRAEAEEKDSNEDGGESGDVRPHWEAPANNQCENECGTAKTGRTEKRRKNGIFADTRFFGEVVKCEKEGTCQNPIRPICHNGRIVYHKVRISMKINATSDADNSPLIERVGLEMI